MEADSPETSQGGTDSASVSSGVSKRRRAPIQREEFWYEKQSTKRRKPKTEASKGEIRSAPAQLIPSLSQAQPSIASRSPNGAPSVKPPAAIGPPKGPTMRTRSSAATKRGSVAKEESHHSGRRSSRPSKPSGPSDQEERRRNKALQAQIARINKTDLKRAKKPKQCDPAVLPAWQPPEVKEKGILASQMTVIPTFESDPKQREIPPLPGALLHHSGKWKVMTETEGAIGVSITFPPCTGDKRFDQAMTEQLGWTLRYPMGERDESIMIGAVKQRLLRHPMRLSDVEQAFQDNKCPWPGCGKVYASATSNTRMREHVVKKHRKALRDYLIPLYSQIEMERDLHTWAIEANFSVEKFDSPTFRSFILKFTTMDPVSASAIRNKFDDVYTISMNEFATKMSCAESKQVFLTLDEWSSASLQSYLGIIVAFIDLEKVKSAESVYGMVNKRLLRRRVIAYEPLAGRDASSLASVIAGVLKNAGLSPDDVIGIISDNCSVMNAMSTATMRLRIPCIAHLLQSVIETLWTPKSNVRGHRRPWVLSNNKYLVFQTVTYNLIRRIRKLFKWIRLSADRRLKFAMLQKKYGRISVIVIHMDVITRWDSARKLLNCYMEREKEFNEMWEDYKIDKSIVNNKPMFSHSETDLLVTLHVVLQHPCRAQESLCEDGPTLPRVMPTMFKLARSLQCERKNLRQYARFFATDRTFENTPISSLQHKFKDIDTDNIAPVGHILNSQTPTQNESFERRSSVILSMVSEILFLSLEFYWPYLDVESLWNTCGEPGTHDEEFQLSQMRGMLILYAKAALSDPAHLDLAWVHPDLYWDGIRSAHDMKQKADLAVSRIVSIYKWEYGRAKGSDKDDGYLDLLDQRRPLSPQKTLYLDQYWFESGCKTFGIAFRVAQLSLLADASSAEIERVNSRAALVDEEHRRSMSSDQLSKHVVMAYNTRRAQQEEKPYEERRIATRYEEQPLSVDLKEYEQKRG